MSDLCVYCVWGGFSCGEGRKNDPICHKLREHLYKQLALCKWSQLSFTCPISSTALWLIATTPADFKGSPCYFLSLCLGYLVFWWFRAFPQAFFASQLNPKKFSFLLPPCTGRSEVKLGCRTNLPGAARDSEILHKDTSAGQMLVDADAGTSLSDSSTFHNWPCSMKWWYLSVFQYLYSYFMQTCISLYFISILVLICMENTTHSVFLIKLCMHSVLKISTDSDDSLIVVSRAL